MKNVAKLMKLLSDPTRLRILMILSEKELCVCQMMGILSISQPLISRNLGLISNAGLLDERRAGKLIYYSVKKELSGPHKKIVLLLKELLKTDKMLLADLKTMKECEEFQRNSGRCDMKTLSDFMARKRG